MALASRTMSRMGSGASQRMSTRIDPDARRRRVTALVNAASLARESPAVHVVEDAHWIQRSVSRCWLTSSRWIPRRPRW